MRQRRALEFAIHSDQADGFRYAAGVCVNKADMFKRIDLFSHFRSKLQRKGKLQLFTFREWIFVGIWSRQSQFQRDCAQDVPCNAIIFTVWIPIAK